MRNRAYTFKLHLIRRKGEDWMNERVLEEGGPYETITQVLAHGGTAATQAIIENRIPNRVWGLDLVIYDLIESKDEPVRMYSVIRREV